MPRCAIEDSLDRAEGHRLVAVHRYDDDGQQTRLRLSFGLIMSDLDEDEDDG